MSAATDPKQEESGFLMVVKWILLRLWAFPTVAIIVIGSCFFVGLIVGQRWGQLVLCCIVITAAYLGDRLLLSGKLLRTYRAWANAHTAVHRVRLIWPDLMQRLGLSYRTPDGALQFPRVRQVEDNNGRLRIVFDSLSTQHLGDFDNLAERFRTAFGGVRVSLVERAAGTYELNVIRTDPLVNGFTVTPEACLPGDTMSAQFGIAESGYQLRLPLDQNHALFGGIPGAGKSVALNVAMSSIANEPAVQIIGIDCRRGMEFTDWSPRLSALAIDQESALDLLRDVKKIAIARADALTASGYRKQADKGYTVDEPLFVVVIDECAELFDTSTPEAKKLSSELVGLVSQIIRVYGRAGGISMVLATQKPTTDAIPSIIRDNVSFRVAFRCKTPEQARAIFGDSASSSISPTRIGHEQKGYCVFEDERANHVMGRSAFVSAESVRQIATASASLRRPLSDFIPTSDDVS
ncbi:hypothetical protein [Microbacterium gorillae]|uniref:hypothetical protein n=1 Tax=Microbacterium gorillae TaxID=1231063 RepID=UPI003D95E000